MTRLIADDTIAMMLTDAVNGVFGFVAVFTAVFAAVARYTAVLLGRHDQQAELATALGFFVGLLASFALLVRDGIA